MLNLNEEDVLFLKELSTELKKQEHDCQASPRFWVIGDFEEQIVTEDYCDYSKYTLPNYDYNTYDEEELLGLLLENEDDKFSEDELEEISFFKEGIFTFEYQKDAQIMEYARRIDEDIFVCHLRKQHIIKENTMFLTKAEAKNHLENNSHHYTRDAHTYAMTAWRAPKVNKLLEILERI